MSSPRSHSQRATEHNSESRSETLLSTHFLPLEEEEEDAVEVANNIEIKEKAIPSSLFSGIGTNDKPMGALERIRMAKQGQN